jgi:hypothetical protein
MSNQKKIKEIYKKLIVPGYFRQGIPEISGIKNKTLKKYIIKGIKKRRLIEIKNKFGKKKFKKAEKLSLKKIEKLLKNSSHSRRTKKYRLKEKSKTKKLSKK